MFNSTFLLVHDFLEIRKLLERMVTLKLVNDLACGSATALMLPTFFTHGLLGFFPPRATFR